MRLRRAAVTLVAATAAVTGLTACHTNVGTAALVDGHRITETDVNDYITPTGARAGAQTLSPRTLVLEYLIQEKIFADTLKSLGRLPTEGVLASYHDAAASLLFQTSLAGQQLDAAINKGLPTSGVRASFTSIYLRTTELEYALIKGGRLTQLGQLVSLVKQAGVQISVAPRYGTWQWASLSLDGKSPTPSYLDVQSAGAQAVGNQ